MAKAHSRKTRRYSNQLKSTAVQLSNQRGVQVQQVAESLGLHPFLLSKWRKQAREGTLKIDKRMKLSKMVNALTREESLKRDVAQLKKENALLKKWQRFLGERRMKATNSSGETETSLA